MTALCERDTGLKPHVFQAISEAVEVFPEIESVVLFGSRAKGTWKTGSDIDLCLFGEGVTLDILSTVSWKLNEEGTLPWRFDILSWRLLDNEELKAHIERVGLRVYMREYPPKS